MEAKKFVRLFLNRNKSDESGYAMILVLGIVILTIGILSSMTLLTIKDVKNGTKNRGVLEARISGESALDSLYAAANANPSQRTDIIAALASFKSSDGTPIIDSSIDSGPTANGDSTSTYYKWKGFFGIDVDGNIVPCPARNTTPCFKVRMVKIVTKPSATITNVGAGNVDDITATRVEYVADIVTRTKCQPNTIINCSYSRVQQNLSLRKYIEYVSISQKEEVAQVVKDASSLVGSGALNPTYSYSNYYSGDDIVSGNIHTNDSVIKSCDRFKSTWITSNGFNGQATSGVYSGSSQCGTGPTTGVKKATRAPLVLPGRNADASGLGLKNIATSDGTRYVTSGNIVFNGTNGTFKVNNVGPDIAMPPSGVLFLTGPSTIQGKIKGKITIASAEGVDITIGGNLEYEGGGTISNTRDMLGVYSGKDIIIACRNSTPTGRCTPINIHGFLKARTTETVSLLGGTIYNPNWALTVAGSTPPDLTLFGAMESYYRGTFGSMDSTEDKVKTGFAKKFTFDSRLTYEQPPFMLRDGTVPFIRNVVKDVPCSPSLCNN